MATVYLKFTDQSEAVTTMGAAGYTLDPYQAHVTGNGWGSLFSIPDTAGHFCNLYDCDSLPESLQQYVVPAPLTPFNVRAGEHVDTVFRTVIVTTAIRDTARALVVAMAGPTHADMWSTPVYLGGELFGYINSGPVRVELAAMLGNAELLAAVTGITLPEAQYILSQCIVTDAEPEQAMADNGLVFALE